MDGPRGLVGGGTDLEGEEAVGLDLVAGHEVVELRGEHGLEVVRPVGDDQAEALGRHGLPRVGLDLLHVQHLCAWCVVCDAVGGGREQTPYHGMPVSPRLAAAHTCTMG